MKIGSGALLGAVVSVGFVVFLLVGMFANSAARTDIRVARIASAERVGTLRSNGKATPRDVDLFYASKRKVPNGPDPIHNRRAETYRRSPGV